jgi:transposase
MNGYQVSDVLWARIEPLISKHVNAHLRGGGRKRIADRTVFNAILFVARTGCQWKALDATGICSGSTAHLRFQEWTQAGVFRQLWKIGWNTTKKEIVWQRQAMDGAMTKAPLGEKKSATIRPRKNRHQTQFIDRRSRHSAGH